MNSLLFEKKQFGYLASILKFAPTILRDILNNVDIHYSEWAEKKIDKISSKVKTYADGTEKLRFIRTPKHDLKTVQRSINRNILSKCPLPPNIHGGVKGKSNITNAKCHKGNKYIFTTDLQEFYPGIKVKQVYGFFLKLGYTNLVAGWLTKLTTWKGELPQGTPTSPLLANLIFSQADSYLIELSDENSITYTRYVDDLTFSSPKDFKRLVPIILENIQKIGFKINFRKTHYQGQQLITGIEVRNNYIDTPVKIRERVLLELDKGILNGPYYNYQNRVRSTNHKKGIKASST